MQIRKILYSAVILVLMLSIQSCSKDDTIDSRSENLSRLQNTWNFKNKSFYFLDGTGLSVFISPVPLTYEFNSDGLVYEHNPSVNSQFSQPYELLRDDSTLIFTIENPGLPVTYDTTYITSLTEHHLVYRGLNSNKTMFIIDSLIR